MRGWRRKILVGLIVYFAGFASCIYVLAEGKDRGGRSEQLVSKVTAEVQGVYEAILKRAK